MKKNKQLLLFPEWSDSDSLNMEKSLERKNVTLISENMKDNFNTMDVPFIGCDFDVLYPRIIALLPEEMYSFNDFDTETEIKCELICAAICHQINWDFLRHKVYEKTKNNLKWLDFNYLKCISSAEVHSLLYDYHKQENIKAKERAELLNLLGEWGTKHNSIINVFTNPSGELLPYQQVHESLLECEVFSTDPAEKKMNLLLQKIGKIKYLSGIANYAKPTIDYHLIRLYLRRGLLYARTKLALEYIMNQKAERKENTVAAIRELCSKILYQISVYTALKIASVNLVEWNVARSVCHRDEPDCELKGNETLWLSKGFNKCPFYNSCSARVFGIEQLLKINEPTYKGTSY